MRVHWRKYLLSALLMTVLVGCPSPPTDRGQQYADGRLKQPLERVTFTGYYTPLVQVRYTPQGEFRYPLYRMPPKEEAPLLSRAEIYAGALDNRDVVIASTRSLIDSFLLQSKLTTL